MKTSKLKLTLVGFFILSSILKAQGDSDKMNIVKFNATGLLFRNVQLIYERAFTKRLSAAVSFGIIPNGSLPYKSIIWMRKISSIPQK